MRRVGNCWSLMGVPTGVLKKVLAAVRRRALRRTDICDHLETIFCEALSVKSSLIVELGVGDGESSYAFERAAKLWDAVLVSVDIEDCRKTASYRKRFFVRSDDVAFAEKFPDWCRQRNIDPSVDVLFIDTSHLYEHTVREIRSWFPHLATRAKVIFHDTNMRETFRRRDGSAGSGWNNERGVIRALEEHFGRSFREENDFAEVCGGWVIRHSAVCNGLTILDRYA